MTHRSDTSWPPPNQPAFSGLDRWDLWEATKILLPIVLATVGLAVAVVAIVQELKR